MFVYLIIYSLPTAAQTLCSVHNCLTCSHTSPLLCLQCSPGFTRSLYGCIHSPSSPPFLIENCAEYNSQGYCTSCNEGFNLLSNSCEPDCPEDCLCFSPNTCLDDNTLKLIDMHREKNKRLTQSCVTNCDTCSNNETCSVCNSSYILTNGNCCAIGCTGCDASSNCSSCSEGYYLSLGECFGCDSHCKSCGGSGSCDVCDDDYIWIGNSRACCSKSTILLEVEIVIPIVGVLLCGLL